MHKSKAADIGIRPLDLFQSILYFQANPFCHYPDLHHESFIYDSSMCIERTFPEALQYRTVG